MDYAEYRFSIREWLWNLALFFGLAGMLSYLFYRSALVFVLSLPLAIPFLRMRRQMYCRRRREQLAAQFLDGMQAVASALTAGYSVETSFRDAVRELEKMYCAEDLILREFHYIASQLSLNRNLEELLSGLALRSGVEDIENFAEIFAVSKRTGGNLIAIIRNTVAAISQKEETRREIEASLSAKKLEQKIMSVVPAGILMYVQAISPGFLDVMYHNPAGIAVMSICLLVYGAAYVWGSRIVEIEV